MRDAPFLPRQAGKAALCREYSMGETMREDTHESPVF